MKIADALAGVKHLYIDSAPLIYFIESYPAYISRMRQIMNYVSNGSIQLTTTVITLTEVLTKPIQVGNHALEITYRNFLLKTRHVQVIEVNIYLAQLAAQLRAQYNLRTPDALQIATAIDTNCDAFLTNDRKLLRVSRIKMILIDDLDIP